MIRPLVESTLDSVSKALQDAGRKPGDMDAILLVGGSTRTPLVFQSAARAHGARAAPGCASGSLRGAGRGRAGVAPRRATMWSACWWMSRRTRSAFPTWASVAAKTILLLQTDHPPQYAAAGDAHRTVFHHLSRNRPRWMSRFTRATTKTRCRISSWANFVSKG